MALIPVIDDGCNELLVLANTIEIDGWMQVIPPGTGLEHCSGSDCTRHKAMDQVKVTGLEQDLLHCSYYYVYMCLIIILLCIILHSK